MLFHRWGRDENLHNDSDWSSADVISYRSFLSSSQLSREPPPPSRHHLLLLLLLLVEQEEQTAPPIPPRPPHADCHRSPSLSRSVHQHRHRIIDWATRKENGRSWVDLYQSPADGSSVATGLPWSNLSESIRRRRKRMKRSAQLWIFQVK